MTFDPISFAAVSKLSAGLRNVDNTSDANKPISIAQAAALAVKADSADVEEELSKRIEAYMQDSAPNTTAPALWFDTSGGFLTLKIQTGA